MGLQQKSRSYLRSTYSELDTGYSNAGVSWFPSVSPGK